MLSILIVNWNTRECLKACLESIEKYPPVDSYEVIVVDNDSSDGSVDMVRTDFGTVKLLTPGKNGGYAAGNNLAFGAAQGNWLLTLNPDTEVLPETLGGAIVKLAEHPECGALGVRQIGPDGETQKSVRGFPSMRGLLGDLTGLGRWLKALDGYRLRHFDYGTEQIAPQPMGTFLLFRKSALAEIGDPRRPFDEGFPIFFNEVDLLYRLNLASWKCLYTPTVSIKHLGGMSTKQVRKGMIWESHNSLFRFFEKHYRTPITAPFLPLLKGLISLGALVRAHGYDAGFKT